MPDSKKRTDALRQLDRQRLYSPVEAIDLVKSLASAKFDETVELAVRLGVDPRRADQIVRSIESSPAYRDLKRQDERLDAIDHDLDEVERKQVKCQRYLRVVEHVALAERPSLCLVGGLQR